MSYEKDFQFDLINQWKEFFDPLAYHDALKLIQNNSVLISFKKGDPDRFFVISGIVHDGRTYESRISYKKRLQGTAEGPLASSCNCIQWDEKKHCKHTIALFFNFHLLHSINEKNQVSGNGPSEYRLGVFPKEFGTLIRSTKELQGPNKGATFTGLQYYLVNGQTVSFPAPEDFTGKLLVNILPPKEAAPLPQIIPAPNFPEEEAPLQTLLPEKERPEFRYSLLNSLGVETKEVSILNRQFLFNWKTGNALLLNYELRNFLARIDKFGHQLKVNDLIRNISSPEWKKYLQLSIDDLPFEGKPLLHLSPMISIVKSDKKNYLCMRIEFQDSTGALRGPVPDSLGPFAFGRGLLGNFSKKSQAFEFLKKYFTYDGQNANHLGALLRPAGDREYFLDLLALFHFEESDYSYSSEQKTIFQYDLTLLRRLMLLLFHHFKEIFFKFAYLNSANTHIEFHFPSTFFYESIYGLYNELQKMEIPVTFNFSKLSTWGGKIHFERKQTNQDWFDIEFQIEAKDWEMIKNFNHTQEYLQTDEGIVLFTPEQRDLIRFIKKYLKYESADKNSSEAIKAGQKKKLVVPFNKARIFELIELKKLGLEGLIGEEEEELYRRLTNVERIPDYDLLPHHENVLRPYQKQGYSWLRFLHEHKLGACLADDMGLGKTLQTIAFLESVIDKVDKILIVCPISILINWEKEMEKFSSLKVSTFYGDNREIDPNAKILITSYGILKKEIDGIFSQQKFDILVLDEVHHLKNIKSQGAMAARRVKATFRLALTGTPVENDLSEFYNIIDLCIPGIWGNLQFLRTISNKNTRVIARNSARPFILRRTKGQVLPDLPDKLENLVYLNFSDIERTKYSDSLLFIRGHIEKVQSRNKYGEILKGLLKLRQMCLWQESLEHLPTKVNFLLENLEQILGEGHQSIIFSQFTSYLDIIEKQFNKRGWSFSRIDGTQNVKKRQKQVESFQSGENRLFLISLKAGGVGINLTAASYVFLMDPWWNPAVERQAIDRAHRIGQKNKLTIYRPIIKNTVEEKVLKLQAEKRELFDDLLTDLSGEEFNGRFSLKDLFDLFY